MPILSTTRCARWPVSVLLGARPADLDPTARVVADQVLEVGAVGAVHAHAAAAGDKAHDLVARHGIAAVRQTHQHVLLPLTITPLELARFFWRWSLPLLLGLLCPFAQELCILQLLGQLFPPFWLLLYSSISRCSTWLVDTPPKPMAEYMSSTLWNVYFLNTISSHSGFINWSNRSKPCRLASRSSISRPLTMFSSLRLAFKPRADLALGCVGLADIEPIPAEEWPSFLVMISTTSPVLSSESSGTMRAVDLGAHARVAYARMDAVSKVDRRRAATRLMTSPLRG